MQIEVKLPQLTEDEADATVDEVNVSAGDVVKKDDILVLVTAGKASGLDVRSPSAGRIAQIAVAPGDTLVVGSLIATIDAEEGAAAADEPEDAPAPADTSAPTEEPEPASAPTAESTSTQQQATTQQPAAQPAAPQPTAQQPAAQQPAAQQPAPKREAPAAAPTASLQDVAAGPAIRRFAREVGVDLSRVTGTGANGRITRDDVLEVVRAANHASAGNASSATESDNYGPVRNEVLSGVRRTIAAQMHKSWSTVPRVTNFDDADVTELERMRQSSKADYADKGIKLTTMPFLIKAVAMSLRDHPTINATVDVENNQISYKGYVNIGVAVDTDAGLVVPNLPSADDKSISEIAKDLSEMAAQVRANKFSEISMKGSTFTISNLGAIGGTYSTPIVNVPEVAILLVGRSRKMPVVVDDQVAIRLMMPLSLSYDHRLVDGGAAARFLNEVIGYLEAPSRLLLAP